MLHHFQPTSLREAFERLGSVQYDPLNPVGRNHDLVLQARVPGYSVGDWQQLAYRDRFIYDAWDKQASLVLMDDYPMRRIYYDWHAPRWREKILSVYPEAVKTVLDELRERGPLGSMDFHYQVHQSQWEGSWYGPKLTKNVLRALWHTGKVQTYERDRGKHVYDLAERVVLRHLYHAQAIPEKESIEWLILLRCRALGLMRPNAGKDVWSLGISAQDRRCYLQNLLERKALVNIEIDGKRYNALPHILDQLDIISIAEQEMRFIAPLDQLMWDRLAVGHLFDFEYVWEVYKPENQRRWGYYVLPVMQGDRFVARIDSRLNDGIWKIHKWYWEDGIDLKLNMFSRLEKAVSRFSSYLRADGLRLPRGMDKLTRGAFKAGFDRRKQ